MAADFGKILEKIQNDNTALKHAEQGLQKAFEKLDSRITAIRAGIRIEPYETGKGGPTIGFRRFSDGWHITTEIQGIGGTKSESPAVEAGPSLQVEVMPHVGGLLGKISDALAARVKTVTAVTKDADKLVDAIEASR